MEYDTGPRSGRPVTVPQEVGALQATYGADLGLCAGAISGRRQPNRSVREDSMASVIDIRLEPLEQVLLARIAGRDRRAMSDFLLLYHPPLARFLTHLAQRHSIVDEIIDDAVTRMHFLLSIKLAAARIYVLTGWVKVARCRVESRGLWARPFVGAPWPEFVLY